MGIPEVPTRVLDPMLGNVEQKLRGAGGGGTVPYLSALTREMKPRVTINYSLFRRWNN